MLLLQPPNWSITSVGQSTFLNLSRKLCLKLWITHPSGNLGLSHLFIAALAEFALQRLAEVYLGNAKSDVAPFTIRFAARSELPISGIFRKLLLVFNWRQGCGVKTIWGMAVSTLMSSTNSPSVSDRRIPVSDNNAMMRLCSSQV